MYSILPILQLARSSVSLEYGPYGIAINEYQKYLIRRLYGDRSTYLTPSKLAKIIYLVNQLNTNQVQGDFVEFGAALGGSSALLAALRIGPTALHIYDLFGMIPPPGKKDTEKEMRRYEKIVKGNSLGIGGNPYYGYTDNLLSQVEKYICDFIGAEPRKACIYLHKGDIRGLSNFEPRSVAFAHVDVDWYEPTRAALSLVDEALVAGGTVVIDDYFTWEGARKAVDDYLAEKNTAFYTLIADCNSLAIIKNS